MRPSIAFIVFIIWTLPLFAFDASQFQPQSFAGFEVSPEGREQKLGPKVFSYDMEAHPYSMVVQYTGRSRKLSTEKALFLNIYGKSIQQPDWVKQYQNEIEVAENGLSHWVPIQSQVQAYLPKEVVPGETFTIYVRYLGSEGMNRIFAVVEYSAPPKAISRK